MLAAPYIIPLTNMAMTGQFLAVFQGVLNIFLRFCVHGGGHHYREVHYAQADSQGKIVSQDFE